MNGLPVVDKLLRRCIAHHDLLSCKGSCHQQSHNQHTNSHWSTLHLRKMNGKVSYECDFWDRLSGSLARLFPQNRSRRERPEESSGCCWNAPEGARDRLFARRVRHNRICNCETTRLQERGRSSSSFCSITPDKRRRIYACRSLCAF